MTQHMVGAFVAMCTWVLGLTAIYRVLRTGFTSMPSTVGKPRLVVHPMLWWGLAMVILLVIWSS